MRNYLKWIVPLLLPLFLIAAVTPTVLPGKKISQYPNKATPGSTDLFVMECLSPATNYNISAFQFKFWITNGFSSGTTVNTNVLATTNYVNAAVSNALRNEVWTNDGTFVFYKNTQVSNTAPVLFRSDGSLFTGSNVWKDLDISDATVITPFYNFETNVVDLIGGMTLADTEDYNFYSFWDVRALRDTGGSGHFTMTLSASVFDTNYSSIDIAARRDSIIAIRDNTGYVMSLQPQHNTVGEPAYFFGTTFSQTGDLMVWSNANSRAASLSNNGDMHIAGRYQETMPGTGSYVGTDANGAHFKTNAASLTTVTNIATNSVFVAAGTTNVTITTNYGNGTVTYTVSVSASSGALTSTNIYSLIVTNLYESRTTLTYSGTNMFVDLQASTAFLATLTQDTLIIITNPPASPLTKTFNIDVVQGGSGGYRVFWDSHVKWPSGQSPVISANLGAWDIISMRVGHQQTNFAAVYQQNFQ